MAAASYAVQLIGSLVLIAAGEHVALLLIGVVLFGMGIGNATSLPPLIAQGEFVQAEVQRVVSLIVALGQATYAFAPAVFGLVRFFASASSFGEQIPFFAAVALVQLLAIGCFVLGRRRSQTIVR